MSTKQPDRLEEFLRQIKELDYDVDRKTLRNMVRELKDGNLRAVPCDLRDVETLLNIGPFRESKCCRAEFHDDHTLWITHHWYTAL